MQKPPFTGHHCSVPFEVPHVDMCTYETSEIRTPPYTGQLTVVPVVSLLERFYYSYKVCGSFSPAKNGQTVSSAEPKFADVL